MNLEPMHVRYQGDLLHLVARRGQEYQLRRSHSGQSLDLVSIKAQLLQLWQGTNRFGQSRKEVPVEVQVRKPGQEAQLRRKLC